MNQWPISLIQKEKTARARRARANIVRYAPRLCLRNTKSLRARASHATNTRLAPRAIDESRPAPSRNRDKCGDVGVRVRVETRRTIFSFDLSLETRRTNTPPFRMSQQACAPSTTRRVRPATTPSTRCAVDLSSSEIFCPRIASRRRRHSSRTGAQEYRRTFCRAYIHDSDQACWESRPELPARFFPRASNRPASDSKTIHRGQNSNRDRPRYSVHPDSRARESADDDRAPQLPAGIRRPASAQDGQAAAAPSIRRLHETGATQETESCLLRKQRRNLPYLRPGCEFSPTDLRGKRARFLGHAELKTNLLCSRWQERRHQNGDQPRGFRQVVEHGVEPLRQRRILGQRPRFAFFDVPICT